MNAGVDKKKALSQALANSRTDGKPRFVFIYNGAYWIDKDPPLLSSGEILQVLPTGLMEVLETVNGIAQRAGDRQANQQGQHRHRPV